MYSSDVCWYSSMYLSVAVAVEDMGCAYSSERARNQMREMGYLSILIDIVCRWHEIDSNKNCPNNYYPLIGLRAITAISNLCKNQVFSELLKNCEKSHEFSQLLSQISESSAQSETHFEHLQNICRELLSLSLKWEEYPSEVSKHSFLKLKGCEWGRDA